MSGYFDLGAWNADETTEKLNENLFGTLESQPVDVQKGANSRRKRKNGSKQNEDRQKKRKLNDPNSDQKKIEEKKKAVGKNELDIREENNSQVARKRLKKAGKLKVKSFKEAKDDEDAVSTKKPKTKPAKAINGQSQEKESTPANSNPDQEKKRKGKKKKNRGKNKYAHLAGKTKVDTDATNSEPVVHNVTEGSSEQPVPSNDNDSIVELGEKKKRKGKDKSIKRKEKLGQQEHSNQTKSEESNQRKMKMKTKKKATDPQSKALKAPQENKTQVIPSKDKGNIPPIPFSIDRLKTVLNKNIEDSTAKSTKPSGKNPKQNSGKKQASLPAPSKDQAKSGAKSLRDKMKERLNAARFRYLNEQLYTIEGKEAFQLFAEDPEAFSVYHEGFQSQVTKWPQNPLQTMVDYVKSRPIRTVVADFGCGDAKLAQSVQQTVHSFDLVAVNDQVTACDMSKVPLPSESVDIAVFCLALMGTNLSDFIAEANRVLKPEGHLLVAEVVSRFEKVGSFVRKMEKMGFPLVNKDTKNKMFIWFKFIKAGPSPPKQLQPKIELLPCTYKKR